MEKPAAVRLIAALIALISLPGSARAGQAWISINKDEETIRWALSASGRCPKADRDGRWLDGTCVQLVSKVAGTLVKAFVPESAEIVKNLLEIFRCERGQKLSGGTAPFLAACVERKGEAAAKSLGKWKELRAHSPDVPNEIPDAPMPARDDSLFK